MNFNRARRPAPRASIIPIMGRCVGLAMVLVMGAVLPVAATPVRIFNPPPQLKLAGSPTPAPSPRPTPSPAPTPSNPALPTGAADIMADLQAKWDAMESYTVDIVFMQYGPPPAAEGQKPDFAAPRVPVLYEYQRQFFARPNYFRTDRASVAPDGKVIAYTRYYLRWRKPTDSSKLYGCWDESRTTPRGSER